MALGLPSVNIVFKQEGITAIERGERGIVALVLKDTKALGGHTVYDITDCPEELSEENRVFVIDASIIVFLVLSALLIIAIASDSSEMTSKYSFASLI